jgi:hypothetical protein
MTLSGSLLAPVVAANARVYAAARLCRRPRVQVTAGCRQVGMTHRITDVVKVNAAGGQLAAETVPRVMPTQLPKPRGIASTVEATPQRRPVKPVSEAGASRRRR